MSPRPQLRRRGSRRTESLSDVEQTSPPRHDDVMAMCIAGGGVGYGGGGGGGGTTFATNTPVTTPIVSPTPSLFQPRVSRVELTTKLPSPFQSPHVKVEQRSPQLKLEDKGVACITGSDATEVDGSSPVTTAAGGTVPVATCADPGSTWPMLPPTWGFGFSDCFSGYQGSPMPMPLDPGGNMMPPQLTSPSCPPYFPPSFVVTQ